jgi:outer membrane protein assembly factor BamD
MNRASRWLAALTVVTALGGGAGCEPSKPANSSDALNYSENARAAYQKALQAYLDRDWEPATELFKEVKRKYGQSRYGKLAELRLADIAFEQEKYAEAVGAYKGFVQGHRNDTDLVYAHYRVCRSLFRQIGDTVLLPPQEERDQANVREAYVELRRFRKEHGDETKWSKEVAYMQQAVTGRLVRHELYVARFYLGTGNFDAAVMRAQYALRNFDASGMEPEAMVLLGETYLKMKKNAEARETFNRVLTTYPESPFAVPAKSFLMEMTDTRR